MDGLSTFFANYLTIRFLGLLVATVIASARGWGVVPFVLLGIFELPKIFVHASLSSLDGEDIVWIALLTGTLALAQYAILAGMILSPRLDPRRSPWGLIGIGALVGCAPLLLLITLGGASNPSKLPLGRLFVGGSKIAAPEATALPDRLVGRWEGKAVIDPEGLETTLAERKILAGQRASVAERLDRMSLRIEYRPDGTSTSTVTGAVLFRDRRVVVRDAPYSHHESWAVLHEKPYSLQIRSPDGDVIAITFLGGDAILHNKVSDAQSGFVKHWRLERQRGIWD
jgi:hypothetical protein